MGCTRRGELDAEAGVDPVVHDAALHAIPHAMHCVLQGGELDAEADVDILKSSETRTEMKLSADQLYHYELDRRAPNACGRQRAAVAPCPAGAAPLHVCWCAGLALGCSLGARQRRPRRFCRGAAAEEW